MKIVITGYEKEQPTLGVFTIDGEFSHQCLAQKELSSPSFIINDGKNLLTFASNQGTSLLSLAIKASDVVESSHLFIPGGKPTHLAYSSKHHLLFGCCYADGTFFSASCREGVFGPLLTYKKQVEEPVLSSCHCVLLDKSEDRLAVVNIVTDQIFFYLVNDGYLQAEKVLQLPVKVGPRHARYNEDESLLYIVTEYSNEVIVVKMYDFTIGQRISTIPNYQGTSYGATLVFTADYKHLFVSNRGEDTIAKFKVLENGLLEYSHSFSCGGHHPRHMIISSDGKYLLSCNKNSNNVTIIDIIFEEIVADIKFCSPSGIVELGN